VAYWLHRKLTSQLCEECGWEEAEWETFHLQKKRVVRLCEVCLRRLSAAMKVAGAWKL